MASAGSPPARWLLVRHGRTTLSEGGEAGGGRYAGWSDVPLSPCGCESARRLGRRLAGVPLRHALTSDLRRAAETLGLILAERVAPPPVTETAELRELHFGAWEGRTYAEIAAEPTGPAVLGGEAAAPGGESLADLAGRVAAVLDRLRADHAAGGSLLVSHGGPLRVLLCLALGLPPAAHWRFRIDHGSLSEVHWDPVGGAQLVRLNSVSHLGHLGHLGHLEEVPG